MTSISLTSGNPETPSLRKCFPSSAFAFAAGTSSGGNWNARFPGDDFSKISPSFCEGCVVALLIVLFDGPFTVVSPGPGEGQRPMAQFLPCSWFLLQKKEQSF